MENISEKVKILRITPEKTIETEIDIAREFLLTVFLNGDEVATLLCSPADLNYLTAGFLFSEGLIDNREEMENIKIDSKLGMAHVTARLSGERTSRHYTPRLITSGCGGGATFYSTEDAELPKVASTLNVAPEDVFALVKDFQHHSETYLGTHGVHSAALCSGRNIGVFAEDIGRHNAVDKVFGKCLLDGLLTDDRVFLTSGRVSFEILHKVVLRQVPVIVSVSAPISLGVAMAEKMGVTLISCRGQRLNVYTNPWRVVGGVVKK
ncbi:formate dehydrogenase accessory sulfurtransferase FdhD [Chloroflexota bacterium]